MTVVYLTENNTRCYGVTFQNDSCVKVQKSTISLFDDKRRYTNNIESKPWN